MISDESAGSNINNLSSRIGSLALPTPPLPIQQRVIDECATVDEEYNTTRMSIETYRRRIEEIFSELGVANSGGGYRLTLSEKGKFSVSIGKRVLTSELVANAPIPVYSANVREPFGYIDTLLIDDFSVDSVLWGIDGDWMVSHMPKEKPFYPTDHCGVLRVLTDQVNPRYMARILEEEGRKMGFSRSYRASIDRVESISFTVPDIDVQNKAMEEVLELEAKIKEAEESLKALSKKRTEIVQKYL